MTMVGIADYSIGNCLPNGSYTGMTGIVQRGEADFAMTLVRADSIADDIQSDWDQLWAQLTQL